MHVKQGVELTGIRPELVLGLMVADSAFQEHGESMVVTSVMDGEHQEDSLHYEGLAADLRLPAVVGTREVVNEIQHRLGPEWDIIREATHIHMEFDPGR